MARLTLYEQRSRPVMLALAILFVGALVAPALYQPSARWATPLEYSIILVFALDLSYRLYLAEQRLSYLTANWLDVVIIVVPFLRPLRMLGAARFLRVVQLWAVGGRLLKRAMEILNTQGLKTVLAVTLILVVLGGAGVLVAEAGGDGAIKDFWTACWWALTTVTAVGYGDVYPATSVGRAIGVLLMTLGVGVFGVFTATVATYFVRSDDAGMGAALTRIDARLASLERKMAIDVDGLSS